MPPFAFTGITLESSIGVGGFAEVFRGRRHSDGKLVAVKVAHGPDPRFVREAAVLSALEGRGAPRLFDQQVIDGRPALVMELVEGIPLDEYLSATDNPTHPDRVLPLFQAICVSVGNIHDAGFIHRDLKPENLIVCNGERVVVLDFGLAIASGQTSDADIDARITRAQERVGTALYMAPEQIAGNGPFDPRTDVYALGVVLFEMLAGRAPFVGPRSVVEQGHIARRPPDLARFAPMAAQLDGVIRSALAKQPADRPATVRELAAAVGGLAAELGAAAAGTSATDSAKARRGRSSSSRRPIALMFVQTKAAAPVVTRAIQAESGVVFSSVPDGYLTAFPQAASPRDGVMSCANAARRLYADAQRCVAHVVELRIRQGPRGVRLPLQPIDEGWMRPAISEPLMLTTAAAEALGAGAAESIDGEFHRLRQIDSATTSENAGPTPSLVGRAALLSELEAAATRCVRRGRPGQATVVAKGGAGKTRLLREVVDRLGGSWDFVELAARSPDVAPPGELLRALIVAALELEEGRLSVESVRRRCEAALGGDAESLWLAVAARLDLLAADDPRIARLRAAPGAYRHTLARAIALALAGRAAGRPLAIVIDDVHFADQTTVDALELAGLGERAAPLWICATAESRLLEARPTWGDRSGENLHLELEPLSGDDTRALLAELVRPVEYVPKPIMDRLVEQCAGIPARAIELVAAMVALGVIRKQPGTQSWFVAADDIAALSEAGLAETLAHRTIGALPRTLRELAELCVILDDPFSVADVAILQAADKDSEEAIDPSVGLPRLARAEVLSGRGSVYSFSSPAIRAELERELRPSRRQLHAVVLAGLEKEPRSPATLVRIARHAAALADRIRAGQAYLELANGASALNQDAQAEQFYSRALGLLAVDDPARQAALIGRGIARYRLWRMSDALEDLRAARAIADERGDDTTASELLLEEATILDWQWQFEKERPLIEEARERAGGAPPPRLEGRLLAAEGRVAYRSERLQEAIALLDRAVGVAVEAGDLETVAVVLLMLAPALAITGDHERSEERFADAIEACESAGDRLHLGAVYSNRLLLWTRIGDYASAVDDGKRAIDLAREVGNAQLERAAQHNVAELLLFTDRPEEGRAPALRARDLEQRFYESPQRESAILVARILATLFDTAGALDVAREVRDSEVPLAPMPELLLRSVELVVSSAADERWSELLEEVREHPFEDEKVEIILRAAVAYQRLEDIDRARKLVAEARGLAGDASPWLATIGRLDKELGPKPN